MSAVLLEIDGRHPRTGLLVYYERGQTLYFEGDEAKSWYQIVRGTVRTCRFGPDGQRQITAFYYPGDVLGIDGKTHSETAEAVNNVAVRCYRIDAAAPPADSDKAVLDDASLLRRALGVARQSVMLLGHKTATERVAAFLLALPGDANAAGDRHLPMSRADIADHLGLTIHTVSRIVAGLVRDGVIACGTRGRLTILDPDALCAMAGEPRLGLTTPAPEHRPAPRPVLQGSQPIA